MTVEMGVSLFVGIVVVLVMCATWWGRGRRMREVAAIEQHVDSLDGRRPALRVVPRHATPKQSAKATKRK